MPRIGLVGIALALCVFAAWNSPSVEASKVSMEIPEATKIEQAQQPSEEITASRPGREVTEPVARPSGHKPVQYDALPEQHRKTRQLDEILGQVAEV